MRQASVHHDLPECSALAPIEVCLDAVAIHIMTIACDRWKIEILRRSMNGVSVLARLAEQALSNRLGYSIYDYVRRAKRYSVQNLLFRLFGIFESEYVYIQSLPMLTHVTQDNRTRFVQMWI